jgi:ABC-type lipoprotein export system ATPase subunit
MFKGSAWGIKNPEFETLSIKELSIWMPDIIKKLEEIGISTHGQEDTTLHFLCQHTGISTSELIQSLSSSGNSEKGVDIESITLLPGKNKKGRKEPYRKLTIKKGEAVVVVGPTGSGKSQLLSDIESLARGDSPSGRKILLNGKSPTEHFMEPSAIRPVSLLSQSMNFILDLSVGEFIEMHALCRKNNFEEELKEKVLEAACSLCGEPFFMKTELVSLSGGQATALMIADSVLISQTPIILIDEIENAGIDKTKALHYLMHSRNITIIATHDPLIALSIEKRIILENGGISKILTRTPAEFVLYEKLKKIDKETSHLVHKIRSGEVLS